MGIEPIPLRRDDRDPRPPGMVGRDIDRVLAGLGAPPAPVLSRITEAWSDLVGPVAAEHCRPGKLVEGRLHVDVDGPAWSSQIRWQQRAILARIDDLVPGASVAELVLRVTPR